MKTWLSYTLLFLALISFVPAYAQTEAAKTDSATTKQDSATKPASQPVANVPAQQGAWLGSQPPVAQPGQADAATAAAPVPAIEEDPLKNIVIHKHPEDFATAQQLALQNRDERSTLLQKSITCVQQATTMDELTACQADERKELDKIRLSYCNTQMSQLGANVNLPKNRKGKGKGKDKGKDKAAVDGEVLADGAEPAKPAKQKPTACDKALAAVTGKPMRAGGALEVLDPQVEAPQ